MRPKGWVMPQETKDRISKGKKGKKHSPERIIINKISHLGQVPWNKGKHMDKPVWNKGLTASIDSRIVKLHKKRVKSFHLFKSKQYESLGLSKEQLSYLYLDINMSPRKIASQVNLNRDQVIYALKHWRIPIKDIYEGATSYSSEKRREVMFRVLRQKQLKPNKDEIKLSDILDTLYPNQYKYVGDGVVVIGGMNPDFININGQKKIIELFGHYWHTGVKVPFNRTEEGRISSYKKFGFDCLVIWDYQLKRNPSLVKTAIQSFHEGEDNEKSLG